MKMKMKKHRGKTQKHINGKYNPKKKNKQNQKKKKKKKVAFQDTEPAYRRQCNQKETAKRPKNQITTKILKRKTQTKKGQQKTNNKKG